MSATVFFVAVQCCQCSTMQVKQRSKKSGNKWTCVVCNKKQSVRKVFAQGSMAKQLRPYVQSFNMSRHHSESTIIHHHVVDDNEEEQNPQSTKKKPRIDWSDYLEEPNENSHAKQVNGDVGGDLEPKILTELPIELFNRQQAIPKSKCEEERGCKRRMSEETSKRRDSTKEEDDVDKPRTKSRDSSKWKNYITEEDEFSRFSNGRFAHLHNHGATTVTDHDDDQTVEDDVHPDFM